MRRKNCFISALLTVVLACGSFTLSSCSGNSEQGIQGETGRGIAHIEIIDGYLWITYTDDLENPVNVGQIEEAVNGSEGLAYILSETNDYYKVRGWGLCSDYNIVIPATYKGLPVKEIVDYAFYENHLADDYATYFITVTIPDSVTTIGIEAFYDCDNLKSVVIGDGVTTIGGGAFRDCGNLTSVVIGDSVTSIGVFAFESCRNLTSVVIPDSITTIGAGGTFRNCGNLTSVYYKGTESDWSNNPISSSNTNLTNATWYYYSETAPTVEGNYWHYDTDGITPVIWVCTTEE